MRGDVIYVNRPVSFNNRILLARMCAVRAFSFSTLRLYRHYGIDAGNRMVVHFTEHKSMFSSKAKILCTSMDEFLDGGDKEVDEMVSYEYSRKETLRRAEAELGKDFGGYNFLKNNCEHFAYWCATGKYSSRQVAFLKDDRSIFNKTFDNINEPFVKSRMHTWGGKCFWKTFEIEGWKVQQHIFIHNLFRILDCNDNLMGVHWD